MENIIEENDSPTHYGDIIVLVSLFGILTVYKMSQYLLPRNFIIIWLLFMITYFVILKYLEFLGYKKEAKTLRNSIFFSIGARMMAT